MSFEIISAAYCGDDNLAVIGFVDICGDAIEFERVVNKCGGFVSRRITETRFEISGDNFISLLNKIGALTKMDSSYVTRLNYDIYNSLGRT